MGITIQVPREHVEHFQLGAAEEIGFDACSLTHDWGERIEELEKAATDPRQRTQFDYLRGNMAVIESLAARNGHSGPCGVREDAEVLAHVAESMARKVIGPKLAEALEVGPIDREQASDLRNLIDALGWAVDRAAECHAANLAEREEREGEEED